jgi:hypothetical protein
MLKSTSGDSRRLGGQQPPESWSNSAPTPSQFPIWATRRAPVSTPTSTSLSSRVPVPPGRGICISFARPHRLPGTYYIFNRNYELLELNVTKTKQTSRPRSNRDKNVVLDHAPKTREARRADFRITRTTVIHRPGPVLVPSASRRLRSAAAKPSPRANRPHALSLTPHQSSASFPR